MSIAVGDRLPDLPLTVCTAASSETVQAGAWMAGRTVVLFAVPGAFTPTCSERHLPGFVSRLEALRDAGAAVVACLSVNDAFVMRAWAQSAEVPAELVMVADGNAAYSRALGLEMDASAYGMGVRCKRFALVAKDGVVTHLYVEAPGEFRVSAAEHVLADAFGVHASA